MALTIGELVGYLRLNDRDWKKTLDSANRELEDLGDSLTGFGKIAGLTVVAGQLARVAGAAAPAAGVLLALPAAGVAAGAAFGTVKLATVGMGDAMKAVAEGDAEKLDEALQNLAPSARAFVRSVQAVKPAWVAMRKEIQQDLFEGLGKQLERVASADLPTLRTGLGKVAGAFNGLAKEAADAASQPFFRGMLANILGDTAGALTALQGAVRPLLRILAALVNLGSPLVEQFAAWITRQAQLAAAWVTSAHGAATLHGWLVRGIATLKQLGQIAANVGSVVVGVFKAAGTDGGAFLATLVQLTGQMAAWVNSAQGQETLASLFRVLSQVALRTELILGAILKVTTRLVAMIDALPAPVQSVVTSMLAWLIVMGPLVGRVAKLIAFLRRILPVASVVGKGVLRLGVAFGRLGIRATLGAAKVTAAMGRIAARYARLAVRALAAAARVALSWLIAMGPIALVIAAVVALVALIVTHWDQVKRITTRVWSAVWGFIRRIWHRITAWIGRQIGRVLAFIGRLSQIPGRVAAWFGRMRTAAIARAADLVIWLQGLPGRILGAIGSLGGLLYGVGQDIIGGLIDGVTSMFDYLRSTLGSVTSLIPDWKGPVSKDRRLLEPAGRAIMAGLMAGIGGQLPALRRQLGDVSAAIVVPGRMDGLTPTGPTGRGPASGRVPVVRLVVDGADSDLKRLIRKMVRTDGRGDVRVAFGR